MSLKTKVLGLSLLAILAVSLLSATSATAVRGGHFTSESAETTLKGIDFSIQLIDPHVNEAISCNEFPKFHGTMGLSAASVVLKPEYPTECRTEKSERQVHIEMGKCVYEFAVGKYAHDDNTAGLVCNPEEKPEIKITGPFGTCVLTITPGVYGGQMGNGVSYTTGGEKTTHYINADVTVKKIHGVYTGNFFACGFAVPTTATNLELVGTAFVEGFFAGKQVGVTATGSLGTKP